MLIFYIWSKKLNKKYLNFTIWSQKYAWLSYSLIKEENEENEKKEKINFFSDENKNQNFLWFDLFFHSIQSGKDIIKLNQTFKFKLIH